MNQKFIISREEDNKIVLKELSELEPGMFQILYTEEFDGDLLNSDMTIEELIIFFRNKSFYPPNEAAHLIAKAISDFIASGEDKHEITFNDKDLIQRSELGDDDDMEVGVDVDVDDLLSDDDDLIGDDDNDDLKDLKVADIDDEK